MSTTVKPSELHPGDVIDWTSWHGERLVRQVVLEPRPPRRGDTLVTNNGMHPGIWISDLDAERLAIVVHPRGTEPSATALARIT